MSCNFQNINFLKEACSLLECQLEEFERIVAMQKEKEQQLNDRLSALTTEASSSKNEIQEIQKQLQLEKSVCGQTELLCRQLQEDVELLRKESSSYKQQAIEYKELSTQLSEDMSAAEDK